MSMFSFIRKGRQAAKEHKAEKAEKAKREAEKPPYRHIPKHAAIDAVSSGPAGWRSEDRQKIVDQNKRRSAMTTSGMNMTGQPRIHSSLSHVSFPAAFATPVVPRTYSHSSMPAGWASGDMNYSNVDVSSSSVKGKEVDRSTSASLYLSRSAARLSAGRYPMNMNAVIGTGDLSVSPVDSSSNSTSSQDDLEMEPIKHASLPPVTSKTRGYSRPMSDSGSIHRLHPARRLSDAEQNTTPTPAPARTSYSPRTSSLPAGIPPVPAIPAMQFGAAITTSTVSSTTASAASSVTMVPIASSVSLHTNNTKPIIKNVEERRDVAVISLTPEPSSDEEVSPVGTAISPITTSPTKNKRRTCKPSRFPELETINSNISIAAVETPLSSVPSSEKDGPKLAVTEIHEKIRPTSTIAATLPIDFDENSLPTPKALDLPAPVAQKQGKLSKNPGRKGRWSLRGHKSAAVAV
ncbi:hypothetical protein QC763_605830 [Podospora pseudopauciseta]|uniref:Uncharacterized protein n=2 Tax=Podospora TaxID=5144 RepID=A0ABR0H472_9PEZI|nr:hypothetical protein QC763_605830 [Podospora pseudopauciseta]KAK4671022.1 hypothetical protein QC764_605830 [Podospora pseudoanserina]